MLRLTSFVWGIFSNFVSAYQFTPLGFVPADGRVPEEGGDPSIMDQYQLYTAQTAMDQLGFVTA